MPDPASDRPVSLEIVSATHPRGPFRCAVFDFDGTLSLLRGDWQGLMVPMMVDLLAATRSGETREQLNELVWEYVTRLTGQPTMAQMVALVEELKRRGGSPAPPEVYLARYLDQLLSRTAARIEDVQCGRASIDEMLVPGTLPLVEALARQGLLLVIASGTELGDVQREAAVLGLDRYFGERVFGPVNGDPRFSKEVVLRRLMAEHGFRGDQIVAIGDGPAEMLAVKAVGGLALGVASDEVHRDGRINRLKREHLIRAGADAIVADYRDLEAVFEVVGGKRTEYGGRTEYRVQSTECGRRGTER
jgi:phosphoglycolate phosphatase